MNVNFVSGPEDRSNGYYLFCAHFVHVVCIVAPWLQFGYYFFQLSYYHSLGPEGRSIFFEGMDLLVCITESANEAFATSQLVDVCWFARISMK